MPGYYSVYNDESLQHHGIMGMKWGVRRYQNADGTLTAAGRKRYGKNLRNRLNATSSSSEEKKQIGQEFSKNNLVSKDQINRLHDICYERAKLEQEELELRDKCYERVENDPKIKKQIDQDLIDFEEDPKTSRYREDFELEYADELYKSELATEGSAASKNAKAQNELNNTLTAISTPIVDSICGKYGNVKVNSNFGKTKMKYVIEDILSYYV